MRDLVILFVHVMATLARLLGPGGIRSVVAESVLVKQQLLILNRSRQRSPNLLTSERLVAGVALCRMFNRAIRWQPWMPKYLSSDRDPLYRFAHWQANLLMLQVTEIKTVPYVPLSHPSVERRIGTIRREYLDCTLFWTTTDLENKLLDFRTYFNEHRSHTGLEGKTPDQDAPMPRPALEQPSRVKSLNISIRN
jgi:putative transposase